MEGVSQFTNQLTSPAMLTEQLNQVKKQLKEYQSLHLHQVSALVDCLEQLSRYCHGDQSQLMQRIERLQLQLTAGNALEHVLPEVINLCHLLEEKFKQLHIQLGDNQQKLLDFTAQLTEMAHHSQLNQHPLYTLQYELKKPIHSLADFLSKLGRVIEHHQQLSKQGIPANSAELNLPQLAQELLHGLEKLYFQRRHDAMIADLKTRLQNEVTIETLLQVYSQLLQLLIDDRIEHKNCSQAFLLTLGQALDDFKQVVTKQWDQSQDNSEQQRAFYRQLADQYHNLDQALEQSQNLYQLKHFITCELANMQQTLRQRQEAESREFAKMKENMEQMRNEIKALTNEAQIHKAQLIEQQEKNLLDPLTQLPNRAALDQRMRRDEFADNMNWIVIADIDHFKRINDHFGHCIGDKALKVVAIALKNSLREGEFVARYGGEEFVLLLPNIANEHIVAVLNRIRERVKNIPFKFGQESVCITLSLGAAQLSKDETMQSAFKRADAALYRAKNKGRDQAEIDF